MKFRPTEFLNTPYRVSCYIKLYRKLFSVMRPSDTQLKSFTGISNIFCIFQGFFHMHLTPNGAGDIFTLPFREKICNYWMSVVIGWENLIELSCKVAKPKCQTLIVTKINVSIFAKHLYDSGKRHY